MACHECDDQAQADSSHCARWRDPDRGPGVPWSVYELWVNSLPERSGIRMAYDGEDLEIMTKGPKHEDFRELLGRIVTEVAVELNIPQKCLGETTWKRPELSAVSKPTSAITSIPTNLPPPRAKAHGSNDVADYPNPDLAIEVDMSPSLVDRPGIYAFLGVAEVWRFDGQTLTIERLDPGVHYLPIETSLCSPSRLPRSCVAHPGGHHRRVGLGSGIAELGSCRTSRSKSILLTLCRGTRFQSCRFIINT